MKRRMLTVAALLLSLIALIQANAEMRITPDGVTTPDNSAALHLSGSSSSPSIPFGPEVAVISGVNNYDGPNFSSGGYFSAADGNSMGIYGCAENNGDGTNFGGYFRANGIAGKGVHGFAANSGGGTNNINYGGYFKAYGKRGRGVLGEATGENGIGVYGKATGGNSTGVWGEGVKWDFYAAGSGNYGPDAAGGEYGPFTGAHEVKFAQGMPEAIVPGLIVSVTGKAETRKDKNGNISLSSTLPTVILSATARDKAVFGVLVSQSPLPEGHWYPAQEGESFGVVNALGEGRVWVTDINGQIRAGDYITTSSIPGYGQMQDDDLLHSYTLGKAIETIHWDQVTEFIEHDGKTYRRYLMAVVYTSG